MSDPSESPDGPLIAALVEVRRCLYSTQGGLSVVRERMEVSAVAFGLSAMIEGGQPEIIHLVDRVLADAGVEVDHDDLARCVERGAEVIGETIDEEAERRGPTESERLRAAIEEARDALGGGDDEHEDSPGNMAFAILSAALDGSDR